ncbi:predicted protein [Naegleria gruberi]|uniref:Predicted protein n=1 Tax=Naegleria gruberi TaxID=5762 RepID=D2VKN3_NAEGR|nr:uncharacterized protein NAEGRDRAFT_50331 [Naegleria gruberi]EFC42720.1 predicted protein [Naegleria gruberi]|eukprot:XP_002675464.1 predicted protein [Naegleria gruberi strain NEG-M]
MKNNRNTRTPSDGRRSYNNNTSSPSIISNQQTTNSSGQSSSIPPTSPKKQLQLNRITSMTNNNSSGSNSSSRNNSPKNGSFRGNQPTIISSQPQSPPQSPSAHQQQELFENELSAKLNQPPTVSVSLARNLFAREAKNESKAPSLNQQQNNVRGRTLGKAVVEGQGQEREQQESSHRELKSILHSTPPTVKVELNDLIKKKTRFEDVCDGDEQDVNVSIVETTSSNSINLENSNNNTTLSSELKSLENEHSNETNIHDEVEKQQFDSILTVSTIQDDHQEVHEEMDNFKNEFSFAENINPDEAITNINLNALVEEHIPSCSTPNSLMTDVHSTGTSFTPSFNSTNPIHLATPDTSERITHSLPVNSYFGKSLGNENSLSNTSGISRKSSMMGSAKSIVELFKQGELSDDLQDDGDDRFRANSSRRKQLVGSWQSQSQEGDQPRAPKLIPSPSRNNLVVDPLTIQKQLGKKIKSMEEHDGEEDVNMSFAFPPTKYDPNRRRSSSQPVQKSEALNLTNSPIVAVSPGTPREEIGSEPLTANNVQVSFKEENEIIVDDLPSASTMVQVLKKVPNRQVNKKRNGNSVNRPQSLQLSFGTVNHINRNMAHRGSEDQPRSIRTVNNHRNSVVSTNRSVSEPFVSESIGEEKEVFKRKCFDYVCSIKIVLFIVFLSVVVVTGISVWLAGYLTTEYQVVNTIAFDSNSELVDLMKTNWMTSVVNYAPSVLNLARVVLTQLEPNLSLTDTLTNERYQSMLRKLFRDTVAQSEMFYQMFSVDLYGNYSGVDVSYSPTGSLVERYIVNNNTNKLHFWRMTNGKIQYYEGNMPLSSSRFGVLLSSVNELKAIDEQRMAKGLDASNTAVWSSIFQITITGKWAIGCSIPYYINNKFTGVLTVIFSLSELSTKLYSEYAKEDHHRVFVIRQDGALLGSSKGIEQKQVYSSGSQTLLLAQNANDTVISSIATKLFTDYGINGTLNVTNIPNNIYLVDSSGEAHFVSVEPITENGLDWLLIHSTSRRSYISLFQETSYTVVAVSCVLVLVSVMISICVSALITSPLNSLKKRVDNLAQMNIETGYDDKVPVTFSEVRSIISSVNQMSKGLNSFSKYVPYDIVATIVKSKQPAMLGVQWKTVTLYFSDIASFTNMTEKMSPDTLVELMCDFFTQQTDIIMKTQGTVDKFIGDSIMAFWNDPVPIRDHELAAVESAFACQEGLVPFNNKWKEKLRLICVNKNAGTFDNFNMKIRIGLHTGECFIGNIGSVDRMNYTCLGDTVNTTSRLESLNSMYGSSIMISENVYAKVHKKFLCKWVDVVCVKGKAIPINIYSVLSRKEHANPDLIKMCSGYQALRELFLSLRFEEAIEFMDQNEDVLSYMAESKEKASYQLIRKKCLEKINEDMPENEDSLFWVSSKLHEK